ncbi:hypothetical protein NDU88_001289 [Pleurodeles waltl]|uniref:Uncharacterized protein n=1 Tax=Pleurodeles waltl TaxID=8319 RepID=A0AAV7M035_PLEWA|nr:hypothetical protein NDU88_001289 [Pleurodeles waltl]
MLRLIGTSAVSTLLHACRKKTLAAGEESTAEALMEAAAAVFPVRIGSPDFSAAVGRTLIILTFYSNHKRVPSVQALDQDSSVQEELQCLRFSFSPP